MYLLHINSGFDSILNGSDEAFVFLSDMKWIAGIVAMLAALLIGLKE